MRLMNGCAMTAVLGEVDLRRPLPDFPVIAELGRVIRNQSIEVAHASTELRSFGAVQPSDHKPRHMPLPAKVLHDDARILR